MANTPSTSETLTLRIDGMSCAHCVRAVQAALADVPGTTVERVDVGGATVAYDPARTSPAALADAVRDAGYEPAGV
ncbi:copper chaperone CopZ [Gemmatimonadetes bacterium T265]|nr:copper chaperone CopZ [Gemmatimonadetes bacterium T265]